MKHQRHILPAIAMFAFVLVGCTNTPLQKEPNDKEINAYLLQRVEALEHRTERNEYAVVGLNRRVTGISNIVNAPLPQYQTPTQPALTQRREAYDEQQPNYQSIQRTQQPIAVERSDDDNARSDAKPPAKRRKQPTAKPKPNSEQPAAAPSAGNER